MSNLSKNTRFVHEIYKNEYKTIYDLTDEKCVFLTNESYEKYGTCVTFRS